MPRNTIGDIWRAVRNVLGGKDKDRAYEPPISTLSRAIVDDENKVLLNAKTLGDDIRRVGGLEAVDDTADIDKPISDSTQNALNLKGNIPSPLTRTLTGLFNLQASTAGTRYVWLATGDSVAGISQVYTSQLLQQKYGIGGYALDAFNYARTNPAPDPGDDGRAINFAKWMSWYYPLTSGQILTATAVPSLSQAATQFRANSFALYVIKESGAGTGKVQFSTNNGGTWSDVTIANGASADLNNISFSNGSTITAAITWTLPIAKYRLRFVNLTGTTSVIGFKAIDTDRGGVVYAVISAGGQRLDDMTSTPSACFSPIITDVAPQTITYEAKEELSGSALSNALDAWKAKWDAVVSNADWIYTLSTPSGGDDVAQVSYNATTRAWAEANNYYVWDAYSVFRNWQTLYATGWISDNNHINNDGGKRYLGQQFLIQTGLAGLPSLNAALGIVVTNSGTTFSLRPPGYTSTPTVFQLWGAGSATNGYQFADLDGANFLGSWAMLDQSNVSGELRNCLAAVSRFGRLVAFPDGWVIINDVGRGIKVREGTNAKQGTATLSSGTVTVSNTSVTANSRIFITAQDNNSTGALRISARVAGTSFTITSSNGSDSGVVAYEIFEPAP